MLFQDMKRRMSNFSSKLGNRSNLAGKQADWSIGHGNERAAEADQIDLPPFQRFGHGRPRAESADHHLRHGRDSANLLGEATARLR